MSWLVWLLVAALAAGAFYLVEGWASGLPRLQRAYPAGGERVIRTQSFASGELGWFWKYQGVLTLSACDRGLKVSPWLRGPFVVPWQDIRIEQTGGHPMTQLVFGEPEIGRLRISSKTWEALRAGRPECAA
jgi:hypothetical protein